MTRLDLKLGFSCNNSCKFCVQGSKRYDVRDKTTKEAEAILERCSGEGIKSVVLTGGEVTIRKDIIQLVRQAKSLGYIKIQIQSNGRLFSYMEFCKKIIDAGATEFCPALHGPTAKVHDFLTSANGSFDQTIRGIKNLKRLGSFVMTNTVITSTNYKHLPQTAKLLVGLNVDQFQLAFIHIAGTAAENSYWIVPRKKQIMPYVKKALRIGIKASKEVMTEAIPYCLMKDFEPYVAEKNIPNTKVIDGGLVIENYSDFRKIEGKAKGAQCKKCFYGDHCEGPWKEYPKLFGWDEFVPVKKNGR